MALICATISCETPDNAENNTGTEITIDDSDIINDSRALNSLTTFVTAKRKSMVNDFNRSETGQSIQRINAYFRADILRAIAVIGVIALITNAIILIVMKIEISLLAWIIRLALILSGAAILLNNIQWKEVKDTSIFLNLLARGKKH